MRAQEVLTLLWVVVLTIWNIFTGWLVLGYWSLP